MRYRGFVSGKRLVHVSILVCGSAVVRKLDKECAVHFAILFFRLAAAQTANSKASDISLHHLATALSSQVEVEGTLNYAEQSLSLWLLVRSNASV